jgi:uroporphyrinogen-III synthase
MPTMATLPLEGLRVLVTRPGSQPTDKWGTALVQAGATVLAYPTIELVPPPSWEPLDRAFEQLARYDWIVFTSASAVRFALTRIPGGQLRSEKPRIAAVGAETARVLRKTGARVDLVPVDQRQEGLAAAFRTLAPGSSILFPRALDGQDTLVEALRNQGCQVDVVAAYQTVAVDPLPALPDFDVAIFASPSALRSFVRQLGTTALTPRTVAVMGPTTAAEAVEHGLQPVVAAQPNIDALISAIVRGLSPKEVPHVVP